MLDFMDMEVTNMKIAVLSGKGGTGKTLISVNLASIAEKSTYIDCDVEEPNGYLYFKPKNIETEKIAVKIPQVDNNLCNGCRKCVEFCKFNALAYINDKLIIYDDICHSCGGCSLLCPERALSEVDKYIGRIEEGRFNNVRIYTGILNVGEATGTVIIEKLIDKVDEKGLTLIDCPPGSACTVMESIKDADYCILVAEPTLFGLHNLNIVYELVKLFDKPFGLVLNKYIDGDNPIEKFCQDKKVKILSKIPFSRDLGILNSNAEIVSEKNQDYRHIFSNLLETIKEEVQNETTTNP